jgi:isopenicillin N synthase-like dioxygenase
MTDGIETLPVIDVGALGDTGGAVPAATVAAIGHAARAIGFFYVTNHGIAPERVSAVFAAAAAFFARPEAEKRAVAIDRVGNNRGYVPMRAEALDPSKPSDLKEAFNVGLELPADDPDIVGGRPFRGLNGWPALAGFRDTLLGHFNACQSLGRRLHRAFAADLGLDPDFFADKIDRPMSTLRLLHYPPRPAAVEAGQLGAGVHTDYGNLTLLATDAVGGLEVRRRDGTWLAAPTIPGAFVVNIGDCLMRWTNDVYVSTPHRVASPPGRERFSVAFFLDPNPDAAVTALPGTVPAGEPPRYPAISAADYLRERLDATYAFRRGAG